MLITIAKFLFTYFSCIYIYQKSFNTNRISNFKNFVFSLILSIIMFLSSLYSDCLNFILPIFLLWIIVNIYVHRPQLSFISITICFTISFCMYILLSFVLLAFLPFFRASENFLLLALCTGFFQILLIKFLFSFKRFRNGIPFSIESNATNIATIICLLFIGFTTYISVDYLPFQLQSIGLFTFIIILAFLIFWWQAQITKTYRHRLLMRELESRRTSEAEKDDLIAKLYAENERLARITHRDNSLITALKDAAIKGLRTDFDNPEEMLATRERLIANIEKLAEGRSTISSDYNEKKARDFDTGLSLLDDLLHHMDSQASEQDIHFSVHFGTSLKDFVPQCISESDLVHTVDDLLKNAFKATRTCESRAVQLQFYKLGKHLVLEVADNGIPFEIRSLVNMGIEKLTTYEDGSGIGLMDIWSTKEKYRATYHLDEYASTTPFSKKISLTFDKKNRYTIRTYRKNEILQMSRRADLQVYDDAE